MLKGEAAWSFTLIFLQMWMLEQSVYAPSAPADDYAGF